MLIQSIQPSATLLWRERREPPASRAAVRPPALARRILKASLFVGAATLAAAGIVLLRVAFTAHQFPSLRATLAQFLPFLD